MKTRRFSCGWTDIEIRITGGQICITIGHDGGDGGKSIAAVVDPALRKALEPSGVPDGFTIAALKKKSHWYYEQGTVGNFYLFDAVVMPVSAACPFWLSLLPNE